MLLLQPELCVRDLPPPDPQPLSPWVRRDPSALLPLVLIVEVERRGGVPVVDIRDVPLVGDFTLTFCHEAPTRAMMVPPAGSESEGDADSVARRS